MHAVHKASHSAVKELTTRGVKLCDLCKSKNTGIHKMNKRSRLYITVLHNYNRILSMYVC